MSLKDELKEYYTVEELAALLRVTDAVIEKLAHGGEIAHDIVDAAIRIPRHEAEKLLGKRRRVKIRRAGFAGLGLLVAVAGALFAWQKHQTSEDEE
jgi:excisionase family DNA binding protein